MEVAAVGWGISIIGWIISPYITKLLDKAYSELKAGKPREDLKNFVIHTIPRLALTLQAAEGSAFKEELEGLVKELKSAFDDTEDILDELQYSSLDVFHQKNSLDVESKRDEAGPSNQVARKNDASQKGATKEEQERRTKRHTSVISHLKNKLSMCCNSDESVYIPQRSQDIDVHDIPKDLRGRLVKNVKNIEELIDKAIKTLGIERHIGSSNLGSENRSAGHGENAIAKNTKKTSADDAPRSVTGRDEVRRQIIEKLHPEDVYPSTSYSTYLSAIGAWGIRMIGKTTLGQYIARQIIKMLHTVNPSTSDSTCLSAIGIWGIPGSGKTTLAQYIVKSVKEETYFNLVIWIHVSKSFSIDGIFKEMFELASKKDCPNYNSRDALVDALKGVLAGKRFLLVLDDIWYNENVHELELAKLLSPLMVAKRGSKILVTSRHENGVTELGPDVRIIHNSRIPELGDGVFLELFMHHAFGQKSRNDTLVRVGREIAQKLKKSPLLAATVGGMLHKSDSVEYWRNVKELKLLDSSDITGPLWWCYQHLNEQAKRCFAYCSVFPRTRHLYRDELVNLWVAEGFISDNNRGWEMETFGQVYFDELVSVSFLTPGGKDRFGKDYFMIHDLLYDVAEVVAGSDCLKIKDGMTKPPSMVKILSNPKNVRHLSIESCNASMITEDIIKLGNLRTLIIFNGEDDMTEEVFDKMFRKLTKLRVLMYQTRIKDKIRSFSFPESIAYLRYLRYLGFQMSWVISDVTLFPKDWEPKIRLPAKLAKLYFLQVLDLGRSKRFDFSAVKDMTNLTNLRHLMNDKEVGFRNIGRLKSLETIPPFNVSRGEGYELEQLGDLDKLRGRLEIQGLESVNSKEEALAANLAKKKRLTELVLHWSSRGIVQADVLEGLCPPDGLTCLKLHFYRSSKCPSWMVGPQKSTMQLQELELSICDNQLLKTINMEHLKSLTFDSLSPGDLPNDMLLLKLLKRLIIRGCRTDLPIYLPALPTSLEYLELSQCRKEFPRSCTSEGSQNWEAIKKIPNVFIEFDPYKDSYIRGEGRGYKQRNLCKPYS